jgi:hypothetical protein
MPPRSSFVSRVIAGALLSVSAMASVARTTGRTAPVISASFAPVCQAGAVQGHPSQSKGAPSPALIAQQIRPTAAATDRTLLDEVGHLTQVVPPPQFAGWTAELRREGLAPERRARLHLWAGEYELGQNEQPKRAIWHFQRAEQLTGATQPPRPGHL